ncbi:MAG: hypothetical protein QM756_20785 [Polyangiaceae bacterium]
MHQAPLAKKREGPEEGRPAAREPARRADDDFEVGARAAPRDDRDDRDAE